MINLKIDGKDVQIASGATILDAAEKVAIKIPTLCYLKKVSPTGACRICAVEVEGADKTMTACNTRAVNGMVVTTQSEKLTLIRRQIIELLLVNHPLDCPVCDAGGECDLQDVCYSQDVVRQSFEADDVNAATIDNWPLIQQVPNRCIMCEKCVKTCHETIGSSALFVNEKGDRAFIDKDLDKCEFCGNCVQVCPTGTMISKPFKFKARPWELRKTPSVCTLCAAQCQLDINSKHGKVLR
ncbi:MAG: 2Fe-2S iron-sulfur cluster-binding protein, partial [Desulfuromonadales bacterium]